MGILASALTDIGMKRSTNQDAIYANVAKHLFIVADGMGGHNGGDIASQMAVEIIPEHIIANYDKEVALLQEEAVRVANDAIRKRGLGDKKLEGMGTTVVSHLFRGTNLYISNVGDSRSYLINNNNIYQLTRDHSLVQEKLNLGFYDREQACNDPQKNVLVRTVGFEPEIEIDTYTYKVHRGDLFITCSDGLHSKVSDEDILHCTKKFVPNPQEADQNSLDNLVHFLVDLANKNGGQDNISVIAIIAK